MEWVSNPWVWLLIALVGIGAGVINWLLRSKRSGKRNPAKKVSLESENFLRRIPKPESIVVVHTKDDAATDGDPEAEAAAFVAKTFGPNGRR